MTERIRVLVADDHAVVRRGLRSLLELQPDIAVVGEAEDGRDATAKIEELRPDVALMDVAMPGLDGISAARVATERSPGTRVLMLSSFGGDERVLPALRAGASDYLTKSATPEQLLEAIRAVHSGGTVLGSESARRAIGELAAGEGPSEATVTILFSDIEGSTLIVEQLGDEAARGVFRDHDRILRAALAEHGGIEVDHEGDAFMFAFAGARQAVVCAVEMQRALARRAVDRPETPRVRMGLNTGDVIADEQGYFGRAVFLAARVARQAAGGQIVVSDATSSLADGVGLEFKSRGSCELKGFAGSHDLYEVLWNESASAS